MSYLKSLADDPATPPGEPGPPSITGCFLCDAVLPDQSDEQKHNMLVLLCDERGVLMMNRYPYSNGHVLVAPHQHAADISDLTPQARAGIMELADLASRAMRQALNCQGINLGMNLGRSAGAGVPGHCHMHLVPRWNGDVNFMQVVAGARVIPQALEESYQALHSAIEQVC